MYGHRSITERTKGGSIVRWASSGRRPNRWKGSSGTLEISPCPSAARVICVPTVPWTKDRSVLDIPELLEQLVQLPDYSGTPPHLHAQLLAALPGAKAAAVSVNLLTHD